MSYLGNLDASLRLMRGGFASSWGQSFDVYRLASQSGSIYDSSPVISGLNYTPGRARKSQIENETYALVVFAGEIDDTNLQLGDVLLETGYENEPETMVFAQRRPLRKPLFVQCPFNITITRPQPRGGQFQQQPVSGSVRAPGYGGVDKESEWGMVLTNGVYSFTNTPGATLATVPAQLLQLSRVQDSKDPDIPAALYRERFVIWIPLLNGVQIQEQDAFNFPNSDRYEAASIKTNEQTGFGGYVIIGEKLGT